MGNYLDTYKTLLNMRLISNIWEYILKLIETDLNNKFKNEYLILYMIYFSLIDDGNVCMSLDKKILSKKWIDKLESTKVLLKENNTFDESSYISIKETTLYIINNYLQDLINLNSVTGYNKIFEIEDNYLYLKKYNHARKGIIESIKRLFTKRTAVNTTFNYKNAVNDSFNLSKGQEEAVIKGFNNNLIITGGPGTGKTTSILFLLLNLLSDKSKDYIVYLIAPSGKASSRMKESIINGLNILTSEYQENNKEVIDEIKMLEESTIHRLLSIDYNSNKFRYNEENKFPKNSIFVVDEASMIDICLFDSLLKTIPDTSKLYIMGDKNQLPSVECGAVFGNLLEMVDKDHIVTLDESKRFGSDTDIYNLAKAINEGEDLKLSEDDFKDYTDFEIYDIQKSKPIYYYNIDNKKTDQSTIIKHVVHTWALKFYKDLQKESTNIKLDIDSVKKVFAMSEYAKILCAENESVRGVKAINAYIKQNFIDDTDETSSIGNYPGQIMMVNTNNKMLDLYNGDSGILVTVENDDTLYFVVKKATKLIDEEKYIKDNIFKLGEFIFYPFRMITKKEIDLAYAITIHKSQGSDYPNILVILPNNIGHPLLNRQIIYTAITRTKGNTYILASLELLNKAKDRVIVRDTNIK